jgi:hypothetical protein
MQLPLENILTSRSKLRQRNNIRLSVELKALTRYDEKNPIFIGAPQQWQRLPPILNPLAQKRFSTRMGFQQMHPTRSVVSTSTSVDLERWGIKTRTSSN